MHTLCFSLAAVTHLQKDKTKLILRKKKNLKKVSYYKRFYEAVFRTDTCNNNKEYGQCTNCNITS